MGFLKPDEKAIIDDFWPNVDIKGEDECWNFKRCIQRGYGSLYIRNKNGSKPSRKRAHRHAYELTYGPIPEGLKILHNCDNRSCCNPKHLYAGTSADNSRDMVIRGRGRVAKGEDCTTSKLTSQAVIDIRNSSARVKDLAVKYGVHYLTISKVRHNKSWQHIK